MEKKNINAIKTTNQGGTWLEGKTELKLGAEKRL